MQMIEDMEECVLCLCETCKLLNIINNEHINALVEVYEVISRIVSYRVCVLNLKQMSRYVQYPFFGVKFFDFCSDSIGQMSLPTPEAP